MYNWRLQWRKTTRRYAFDYNQQNCWFIVWGNIWKLTVSAPPAYKEPADHMMSASRSGVTFGSSIRSAVKEGSAVPDACWLCQQVQSASNNMGVFTICSFTYWWGRSIMLDTSFAHSRAVCLKPAPGNQSGRWRTKFKNWAERFAFCI